MKPSYKFIESLHSTLFSQGDEWASSIKAEIEKKQSKLASLQPEARTAVELNIDKLREDVDKVVYSWNVKPFNSMENAKLLLANAHLLDDPILSTHFNPQAVIALKNMLRENFGKIYKDNDAKDVYETQKSLDLAFNDVPLKILPKILNEELLVKDDFRTSEELEQLMNPEDGESDEWEDVEDEEEGEELDTDEEEPQEGEELDADEEEENAEAEEAFNQFISTIIANNKHIDLVFTKQIAEILSITERFYTNSANISPMLALTMSSFFTNIDDVTTFLGNKVDYTSTTTVENSFPPIFQIPNICVITKQEREMWSELNAQYGKKSMSMFVKRDELSTKIDLEALFKEDDLESIFNQLTETAKQLEFTRASEHPELAKMVADFDMPEKTFERILDDIIPSAKEMDDLPDINFSINYKDNILTFQKLPAGDIKGLFLGKMTGCCQSVEGDAEKAVIAGFTRADAGFYTLTDKDGKVKAQSYAWIGVRDGKKVLVLVMISKLRVRIFIGIAIPIIHIILQKKLACLMNALNRQNIVILMIIFLITTT